MQIEPGNQDQEEVKPVENQDQDEDLAKKIPTVTPENLDPLPDEKDDQ